MGIGGTAKWSEKEICDILGNSCLIKDIDGRNSSEGDVNFKTDNYNIDIEVKSTENNKSQKSVTLNQVRAIKYNVLVCVTHNVSKYLCDYIVYPPNYLVWRGITHKGQHTPDGIYVQGFQPTKKEVREFGIMLGDLNDSIVEAYKTGQEDKNAHKICEEINKKYSEIFEMERNFRKIHLYDFDENLINIMK